MSTICIKSSSPDKAIPLLADALSREKRIISDSLAAVREKINALAETLGVDLEKLMRGEVEHAEASDMQFVELEGEVELMRHLEDELKELDALEICR